MQTQQHRYGLEPDDDAIDYNESAVVNVTDEEVVFKIATHPGAKAKRYRLAPFGKQGSSVNIEDGYTRAYKGSGREMCPPIIETKTTREVYPRGPRLPMVVHHEQAEAARAAWLRAFKDRDDGPKPVKVQLEVDPRTMRPSRATITDPNLEEVAQDSAIEPPHPEDAEVFASGPPAAAPASSSSSPAPASTHGGKKGRA